MDAKIKEYIEENIKSQIEVLKKDLNDKTLWDKNEAGCSVSYMTEILEDD